MRAAMNDCRAVGAAMEGATGGAAGAGRVLILDLNNFSSFPTLAVGLLTASLRRRGVAVSVLCPLDHGVPAAERERREGWADHFQRRVHLSTLPAFRGARDALRAARHTVRNRPDGRVLARVRAALAEGTDAVLISAYLQHHATVREIGRLCGRAGVPLLLGGPMFNVRGTADAWRDVPGLAAIVGAEADLSAPAIVEAVIARGDLLRFPGVTLPDGRRSRTAPPLRPLDETPFADFADFPWERYPVRIVPMMTGRGCQWSRCVFCSDVVSASGRTYRTRSVEHVLLEMQEQARRHATRNFLFLDLKLNSWPDMLRAIADRAQSLVPGAEWIGTVHVDERADNGLSRRDLRAAVRGGMRRVSFGLESGSQRLLDSMRKGSSVEGNARFIREAHEAGLSVRCTMFKGFPGETAEDMRATADFLEAHEGHLDRVRFNEFSLLEDTPIYERMFAAGEGAEALTHLSRDHRNAKAGYRNSFTEDRAYRREKRRALGAVFRINRRPVRSAARQFDGLM